MATPAPAIAVQLPRDLSPWGMFMNADIVVKAVMVGLAFASVLSWTIWLAKTLELMAARARLRRGLRVLSDTRSLADALVQLRAVGGEALALAQAADRELQLSADALVADGVKERVASRLSRIEATGGRRMIRGTGWLATIGATAPFVGLFGTVWGIMNSFIGISKQHTTNLAVAAPGIAEALLATALGLVAAIPAVVMYNMFSRWTAGYRAQAADAAAAVLRLVSRDLDRGVSGSRAPNAGTPQSRRIMAVRLDHGEDTLDELHEINVTPFIDVMLVLLIIFMIAAPLATVDIAVNLPSASAERSPRPDKPLFVTLKARPRRHRRQRTGRARRPRGRARPRHRSRQGKACLPARRQERALRRADESDERLARCRLSARGAGRPGNGKRAAMSGRLATLMRWSACFVLVLGAHAAAAVALLDWHSRIDSIASAPAILIDLAPAPAAPAVKKSKLPPGPQKPQAQAAPSPTPQPDKSVKKAELTPSPDKAAEKSEAKPAPKPIVKPQPAPVPPMPHRNDPDAAGAQGGRDEGR